MAETVLETDYLVVGTGAVGMAFADMLLTETDADIVLVDRFQKPGGHWNVAYPFVTLHQPSTFYGVSSRELSKGVTDKVGLNKGLLDLASGAEVSAYFDDVMRHQFLPSGRVRYYPMSEYEGDGIFRSKLSGAQTQVRPRKKTVDATWLNTTVPSTHTPNFNVADGVRFMPLNDLPKLTEPPEGYVIIGGGKTGIDAVIWLLQNGVDPDTIRWIMPRDGWLLNRKNTQPDMAFFADTMGAQAGQFEAIANATSIEDMFDRLEACGYFVRIDTDVRPSMFHGATVSELELEELRKIKQVVRMGRVTSIGETEITLEQGTIPTGPGVVHVDCSARAISNDEIKPIFQGDLITPQMVRSYQPVFSAALIAHVEAAYDTDEEKNALCGVVPLPNHDTDFIKFTSGYMMNQYNWNQDNNLRDWLLNNRLDGFSRMIASVDKDDAEKQAILKRISENVLPAVTKLMEFQKQLDG